MNDQDYILLFDENGQPYIAHASLSGLRQRASGAVRAVGQAAGAAKQGVGRGVRTAHKYIQKIEENGRTRYFYTQEELKAYFAEKKAAAQQTANQVKEKAKAGMSEAQEKASQARTKLEQMGKEFQKRNTGSSNKNDDEAPTFEPPLPEYKPPKLYSAGMKGKLEKAKDAADKVTTAVKDTASKASEVIQEKLSQHNGSPSNSEGETRSMLGSYAVNIPSDPGKLKEWADKGKDQAQQIIDEAEAEMKKIEQDFKAGKITQQQMWIAQGIMEGLRDEMDEWNFLSSMDSDQLSQMFGPLLKKK